MTIKQYFNIYRSFAWWQDRGGAGNITINDLNDAASVLVNITMALLKVNNAAEATTFAGFPDTAFTIRLVQEQ